MDPNPYQQQQDAFRQHLEGLPQQAIQGLLAATQRGSAFNPIPPSGGLGFGAGADPHAGLPNSISLFSQLLSNPASLAQLASFQEATQVARQSRPAARGGGARRGGPAAAAAAGSNYASRHQAVSGLLET